MPPLKLHLAKLNKTSDAVVVGHQYIQAYHSITLMNGWPLSFLFARLSKVASKAENIGHAHLRNRISHCAVCNKLSGPVPPHHWELTGGHDNP